MSTLTLQQRYAMLDATIAEGRLIRNKWTSTQGGRQLVCLIVALAPECGASKSSGACPSDVMPAWLAELTPWIDDNGSEQAWGPMVRRYAALARRWHVLTDTDWYRVQQTFLAACCREALSSRGEGRDHQEIQELLSDCASRCDLRAEIGKPLGNEAARATRAAEAAEAAKAARATRAAEAAARAAARATRAAEAAWVAEAAKATRAAWAAWAAEAAWAAKAAWAAWAAEAAWAAKAAEAAWAAKAAKAAWAAWAAEAAWVAEAAKAAWATRAAWAAEAAWAAWAAEAVDRLTDTLLTAIDVACTNRETQ
jgi:hypothetical protein